MIYANPFHTWTGLLRELHHRFLAEIRNQPSVPSPYFGEIIGSLAGIITQSETVARRIDALERNDPAAFAAFQRTLEWKGRETSGGG